MLSLLKTLLFGFITFSYFGCDSSVYTAQTTTVTSQSATSISGQLADGYISGATLCIDQDLDGFCESNISKTLSDNSGVFSFSNLDTNSTKYINIIANGGIDTSTEKSFVGHLKNIVETQTQLSNIIISPLTDLVAVSFLDSDLKDSFALSDAKTFVAQTLGINITDIYKDPMKNITIFAKSQELQHTKYLLQTAFEKRTTLDTNLIEEKIKAKLLNHALNIEQTIIALEINLHVDIPENEKVFIKNQIVELKNTLNNLSKDTSLDIDNLNRLQKSIDKEQTEANQILAAADENTTLEVVKITTTAESITQSIFDTKDAILDEQACQATNGYNLLQSSNFTIEKSIDATNGIGIMSEFDRGDSFDDSLVQIFYPNLDVIKIENDDIVVFQENYYFSFNRAYNQNTNKTVYVMTPKNEDGTFSCYRFELNFSVATNVQGTKVFKYSDI